MGRIEHAWSPNRSCFVTRRSEIRPAIVARRRMGRPGPCEPHQFRVRWRPSRTMLERHGSLGSRWDPDPSPRRHGRGRPRPHDRRPSGRLPVPWCAPMKRLALLPLFALALAACSDAVSSPTSVARPSAVLIGPTIDYANAPTGTHFQQSDEADAEVNGLTLSSTGYELAGV